MGGKRTQSQTARVWRPPAAGDLKSAGGEECPVAGRRGSARGISSTHSACSRPVPPRPRAQDCPSPDCPSRRTDTGHRGTRTPCEISVLKPHDPPSRAAASRLRVEIDNKRRGKRVTPVLGEAPKAAQKTVSLWRARRRTAAGCERIRADPLRIPCPTTRPPRTRCRRSRPPAPPSS